MKGGWGAKTWTKHLELDLGDLRAEEVRAVGHGLPCLEQQHPVFYVQDVQICVQVPQQVRKPQHFLEEWQDAVDLPKSAVSPRSLSSCLVRAASVVFSSSAMS
jgi:hypothetical protein